MHINGRRRPAFGLLLADVRDVLGLRAAVYVSVVALAGAVEGIGFAVLVPLLAFSGIGGDTATAAATGGAVAVLQSLGIEPTLTSTSIATVSVLVAGTALFLLQARLGTALQAEYVLRWQQRLASAIFRARWEYLNRKPNGTLVNAVVTETQRLGGAFYQGTLLVTGVLHAILYLLVASALAAPATAMLIAGGGVLFVLTRPLLRRAYTEGTRIAEENARLQSTVGELIAGAKLVKATGSEETAVRLVAAPARRLRQHHATSSFDVQVTKAIFDFGTAALCAAIFVVGRSRLGTDPAVTIVVLAIFVRLLPKLTGIQYSLQSLTVSLPALSLLHQVLDEAKNAAERGATDALPNALRQGPLAVRLEDVEIVHGGTPAVSNVTLDIPAGALVAVVGESGAGKSTLCDAMLRLVPISAGCITLNGISVERIPAVSLRRRIGYVGQETVLYDGTIAENITFAQREGSPADLIAAIRFAGLSSVVERLTLGVDTRIGDGGALLSGGERQRLSVARAVLGHPGLLVLDEATSGLDAQTEAALMEAVAGLRGSCTVVMIAHRLSSVRLADRIVVMDRGRLVDQGKWDELICREGPFRRMWSVQQGDNGTAYRMAGFA